MSGFTVQRVHGRRGQKATDVRTCVRQTRGSHAKEPRPHLPTRRTGPSISHAPDDRERDSERARSFFRDSPINSTTMAGPGPRHEPVRNSWTLSSPSRVFRLIRKSGPLAGTKILGISFQRRRSRSRSMRLVSAGFDSALLYHRPDSPSSTHCCQIQVPTR